MRWNVKFVRCIFFLKQIIEIIFSCLRERRSLKAFDCTLTQTGPSVAAARSYIWPSLERIYKGV